MNWWIAYILDLFSDNRSSKRVWDCQKDWSCLTSFYPLQKMERGLKSQRHRTLLRHIYSTSKDRCRFFDNSFRFFSLMCIARIIRVRFANWQETGWPDEFRFCLFDRNYSNFFPRFLGESISEGSSNVCLSSFRLPRVAPPTPTQLCWQSTSDKSLNN